MTDSLRAQIAEQKQELLQFLSSNKQRFIPPPIIPRKTSNAAPLSFAQERLWFLEQLEPGSVYNICRVSRLTGQLNLSALEVSLNEIVRRHEVLRSAIRLIEGRPVQIVAAPFGLKIAVTDLHPMSDREREQEISSRIQQAADKPFDFSADRFLRAALLRVGKDEHILVITTHHIVSDAWSMGILTRELWSLYEAYAAGDSSPLEDLQIQYADFAVWQRKWLQGEALDAQVSYWKKRLKDLPNLNLPADRPRPARQSFDGARTPITLPEPLTAAINELSNQYGVTPFMTLLAAFQVLLYRYCGQEDIVIGSPIANRTRTELEPLIGFFVNTLVLRSDLAGNPTFKELVLRVREVCLGAFVHQDLPFEKLVQELQPERDQSRNPLFQVMFVLQNATRPFADVQGLRIEPVETENTRSQFDLSLFLREREGRYVGYFQYATHLFDALTIERMAGHLRTLLEGIAADSDRPISTLPLLSDAERHQLFAWNDTAADYPKDSCIHELFEAQVERTPDAVALEFAGDQITYQELNRCANRLAHCLIDLGVGPEKLVGLYVERSLELVIGLLGILKAGGAYVPLDPTYPKERIAFMLADANASVLLTSRKLLANFPDSRVSIALDDSAFLRDQKDWNPSSRAKANDPAYVIYTSGSTGTPNGVIGLHRGAVNRMAWMWRTYPFARNEKNCLKTSASFVDSVWETFGSLLQGVPTLIIPDGTVKDTRSLVRTLAEHRVTRIVLVPSLLRAILDERLNLEEELPYQIIWTSSGEHLPKHLAERFRNSLPNSTLLNLYGASEVSADVTYHDCSHHAPGFGVSIGRPISNTQIYLLDSQRQPVPIGVSGELYVGGDGLARGYLNRRELTAERFVADPFDPESHSHLYRTGDLARYRPEGTIELLGRTDRQVKIRGYRVAPEEVESILNEHPAIRKSVVAWDEITKGQLHGDTGKSTLDKSNFNRGLVAYIVPNTQLPNIGDLRNFMKEKLPEWMIPSAFVMIETVPLTPNGKVDRCVLPPPDTFLRTVCETSVAPHTESEELLSQVWKEVLKVDKVGVEDNFFDLGGHSLIGVQIVSRLRDIFRREIPLRILFEAPTVARLAAKIDSLVRPDVGPQFPSIVRVLRKQGAPLSLAQEQLWRLDQMLPGTHLFNMCYVCRLSGRLKINALQKAVREIIWRHEALRTVFHTADGNPVQVVKDDLPRRVSVTDLRVESPADLAHRVAALILEERERPFDLAAGPLVRTKLLRLTDREHILLITLHHIIADQWSMRLFCNELASLYEAFSSKRTSPLPEPLIQFADYACWERQLLDDGGFNRQLAYWRKQLTGPPPQLGFHKRGKAKRSYSFRTSRRTVELNADSLAAIKAFAQRENCTPFMVVLTALNVLLYFHTGQTDLRVGTLLANRTRSETSNVMGHFLNTVVLRIAVSPDMSIRQLLTQVRDVIIAALAHQDLPFEHLARTLESQEGIRRESLFQVLCNYQVTAPDSLLTSGMRVALSDATYLGVESGVTVTTLDLIFYVTELSTKLTIAVNYKSGIFGKRLITRLINNLVRLLETITLQPAVKVASIPLDCFTRR